LDYSRVCFVIMPFGRKDVAGKTIDFDQIYTAIFEPAIGAVALPEGGNLASHRTDQDFFTGDIKMDMFRYLEYSRFALADISGLNFNVAYELGVRHRVREAGTAIFRQTEAPIPFDISSIKAFPYEYEPEDNASSSRQLITRVLTESLARNNTDSPVRIALDAQRTRTDDLEQQLRDAENAIRVQDWNKAMAIYRHAIPSALDNVLLRVRLGVLYKDRGRWEEALEQFTAAALAQPSYAEALREKGIVENKLAQRQGRALDEQPAPGELSLREAVRLNAQDFDAYASLGGVLKRAGRFEESRDAYAASTNISGGHPYPLLNELKLRAFTTGRLDIKARDNLALMRAARVREIQVSEDPPYDKPWCFFDLAEIRLYQGKAAEFQSLLQNGAEHSDEDWQIRTCLQSLKLLEPAAANLAGLVEGIAFLESLVET
jgi:tetratricopeptide (TPR) repeat protein